MSGSRSAGRASPSVGMLVLCALAPVLAAGCDSLLDVENPGTLSDEDVRVAENAELWANGALRSAQAGWDGMLVLLSTASDEMQWGGAHQWWQELDHGWVSDPGNAALNREFGKAAAGQWMADEAIGVLDSLRQAGALADPTALTRTYLYGALAYSMLADGMEDYARADRRESGPPIGSENMESLYDTAVAYATRALALDPGVVLRRNLLAMRARAGHARQVWRRIRPPPADVSGGGLVTDAATATDALAALALGPPDWRYSFAFPFQIMASITKVRVCGDQLKLGARYQFPAGAKDPTGVALLDPIDDIPDPWLERFILTEFLNVPSCGNLELSVFSAREMHFIVAEDALARGDTTTFAEHVNAVRAYESLTPWTPTSGVEAREMLVYERQSQLFLTGRRLADMYRFGILSDTWHPGSPAAAFPGTLFPIPSTEVESNCYLNGSCG